jgi:hypothetical protein
MSAQIVRLQTRAELRRKENERILTELMRLRGKITKQQFDAAFSDFAKGGPAEREFVDAYRRALWPAKQRRGRV